MAIDYKWGIVQLDCHPEVDGVKDVICCIHWVLTGKETVSGKTYTGYVCGAEPIPKTPKALQCSCDGMSLETAIKLLHDCFEEGRKDLIESAVAKQIADAINPSVTTTPLPWA